MDAVAGTLADVTLSASPPAFINIVHSHPVRWDTMFGAVGNELDPKLSLVPFDSWFRKLENASHGSTEQLDTIVSAPYWFLARHQ